MPLKAVLWLCILLSSLAHGQALSSFDLQRRSAAIEAARAGHYDDALAELATLRATYPVAIDLLYDEIVVLGWAERDSDVQARLPQLAVADVPVYVQLVVAKSLRNLREFDGAVRWYVDALNREPDNVDAQLGLVYSYADAGNVNRAREMLAALTERDDRAIDAGMAAGYVAEREGRWLAALTAYDGVLEHEPGFERALRGKALVLRQLLLPHEALELAAAHPGILGPAEIERLRADEIALQVRYGSQVVYPPGEQQYAMTDRAIAALDTYLAAGVSDELTQRALRSDRVIALAERRESRAAVAELERLRDEGVDLSAPVLAAGGKAYLDLHEPEEALGLLDQATELEPNNFDLQFAMFFAYADLNRHDEALSLARGLAMSTPLVSGGSSAAARQPNPDRLRAEILVALALAYADRLDEAQAHLEHWLSQAPGNADLRHELASIYRWRGWLDRSAFEYRQVLAAEPELLEARVGMAQTAIDRRDYEAADADVSALNEEFARQPAVERLTTTWIAHDSNELRVDANAHDSTGVTFGSRQYDVAVTWLSAPLDYRYRGYASVRDAFAEFPEGDSRRRRLAAGLQYEYGRWLASAELSGDRDGGGLGGRLRAEYRFDDYWSFFSTLELDSDAVLMRGYRVGLESDLLGVGMRFAPDETWSVEATGTIEDFSDGNGHEQLSALGRRRLVNHSSFVVELIGEAFVGSRSRNDVPYFSPLRDAAMIVGLESQWRAVRRYERRLTHILRAEIGTYDQSGFARGSVWRLAYMLPVELSPTLSTWFGLWRNHMYYDGEHEDSTTGAFSLQMRF